MAIDVENGNRWLDLFLFFFYRLDSWLMVVVVINGDGCFDYPFLGLNKLWMVMDVETVIDGLICGFFSLILSEVVVRCRSVVLFCSFF